MAGNHGGKRPGAGRPLGARSFRGASAALIERARIDENIIPTKFEGDSLAFLKATMEGKIWPTREQIYAAKSVLPIEYSPAVTVDTISSQSIFLSDEYFEFEQRALKVLRKHPEALQDWLAEFGGPVLIEAPINGNVCGNGAEETIDAAVLAAGERKEQQDDG